MAFQLNQFKMSDQVGQLMNPNANTISVRLSKDMVGTVKAGDVLKFIATETGDCPVMGKAASADIVDAVVIFQAKKATFAANDIIEVAMLGSIISMVAGAAINRGVAVSWNSVSGKLQSTTTNHLGKLLDISTADGDIVRVQIQPKVV